MLKKLIAVENLGPFDKLVPKKEEWGKLVAIYGENGSGKTTLSSLLRAAAAGDSLGVQARKSLDGKGVPRVQFLTDDAEEKVVAFDGTTWTRSYPRLLVFNREFMHDNVYVGREIGADQRERFYELAIGPAAVKAKQAVEAEKNKLSKARERVKALEGELSAHLHRLQSSISDLQQAPVLTTKPETYDTERAQLLQRQSGNGLANAPAIPEPPRYEPINFEALRAILDSSVESLAQDAADAVRAHIQLHLDGRGERWLAQGLEYAGKGEACPYCGQSLQLSPIAAIFPKYFNKAYEQLLGKIEAGNARLNALESWAAKFSEAERAIENAVNGWRKYMQLAPLPDVAKVESLLRELTGKIRDLLSEKKNSPLVRLSGDARLDKIQQDERSLRNALENYLGVVDGVRAQAKAEADNDKALTLSLASRVRKVELGLLRGEPGIAELLAQLEAAQVDEKAAADALGIARTQLESTADAQSKLFVASLNQHLKDFGASFQIESLAGKQTSTRVSADYQFKLLSGGRLKASSRGGAEPSFDTVLSDGDRNALGLAVFATMAFERTDLAQCSIVLDDPFTSLDESRRAKTCHLIRRFHEVAAQVVVLSHDKYFIRDAIKGLGQALQRALDPAGKAQTLLEWDVESACQTEYFRRLDNLRKFATDGSHGSGISKEVALSEIRPLLEEYLRIRFPACWEPTPHKSKPWLGDFVAMAKSNSGPHPIQLDKAKIAKLEYIKDQTNAPHHGGGAQVTVTPSEQEVIGLAKEVLEFVQQS